MNDPNPGEDRSWSLGGQPTVLIDAAATLRAAAAQTEDQVPVPREFALNAIAKLLETIGRAIDRGTPLPHELVEAGNEIARHVRRYHLRAEG